MNNYDNDDLYIGSRIFTSPGYLKKGTIEYIGPTQFASGEWIGVTLDSPDGKNNGSINNIEYFRTKDKYGLFVRRSQCKLLLNTNCNKDSVNSNKDTTEGEEEEGERDKEDLTPHNMMNLNHTSYFREKLIELQERVKKLNINKQQQHCHSFSLSTSTDISSPNPDMNNHNSSIIDYNNNNHNTNTADAIKIKQYSIITTSPYSNTNNNRIDYACYNTPNNNNNNNTSYAVLTSSKYNNNVSTTTMIDINNYKKVMYENKFLNEQIRLQNKMIQHSNNQIEDLKNNLFIIKNDSNSSNSTNIKFHNKNEDDVSIQKLTEQILLLEAKLSAATWELNHNNPTNSQSRCCLFC